MAKLLDGIARRLGYIPKVEKREGFIAALHSRLTSDWITSATGPNAELSSAPKLRERARDLEKNSPLVRRYLHLVTENVVGPHGIALQCANMVSATRPNTAVNRQLETAWWEWGQPRHASVDGRLGLVQLLQLAVRGMARDGEAFIRLVRRGEYGLQLQLVDPMLVDELYDRAEGTGGPAITKGIEVDEWGRPVAYHVLTHFANEYPGLKTMRQRVRVPADEMLHLFVPRRPGQVRGESWLAPVMLPLKMLDGYAEAELVAARTAAAKMGFIERTADAAGLDPDGPVSSEMEAAPGVIDVLNPGETFKEWNPSHPSQNFGIFVTQITKLIAAGLNTSYAALTSDLRETNFSSGRIGLLQERDGWRVLQQYLIASCLDPLYDTWREQAWMAGRLSLRMAPSEYTARTWQPRGWDYVNPSQEQMAKMLAVASGFTSIQRVVAEQGLDLEEIVAEQAAANALFEQYGVDRMVPNSLVVPHDADDDDGPAGNPDASGDGGPRGAGDAGGRRDAHPRVTLVRRAG
jgi:lambda family phage portal protein